MSAQTFKKRYAFYIAIVVSVLLILQQYTDYLINNYDFEFSWFAVSAKISINFLLWAALFTVLIKLAHKLQETKFSLPFFLSQIIISMAVSIVHRIAVVRLYDVVYYFKSGYLREFLTPGNQVQLGAGVFSSIIQYWVIMVLIVAVLYYTKYLEKQKELNIAHLNALQMQLQPHFLFNTLNSITSLIDIDSKKAQKMLSQLGYLMREMLEHDNKHYISLQNELEYIKTYLDIEHIRFQDRLVISYNIDSDLLKAQVPSLILQPIVENAIKHGISKCPDGGEIVLTAKASSNKNEFMELTVVNDYRKVNGNTRGLGFGIGTDNVKKRLKQLYGNGFTYERLESDGKYQSKITIPLEFTNHD